jgi:hypothetical protein
MALIVSDPAVTLFPDQSPDAVQLVTWVPAQLSVVEPLVVSEPGFAVKESVGTGSATVTLTVSLTDPLVPLQVKVNVLSAISAPVDCVPAVARLPDQSPEALQPLVLPLSQLKVVEPP